MGITLAARLSAQHAILQHTLFLVKADSNRLGICVQNDEKRTKTVLESDHVSLCVCCCGPATGHET